MRYALFNLLSQAKGPFSRKARAKRARRFVELMTPQPGDRVIDLGGTPAFWDDCPVPLRITIVNLDSDEAAKQSRGGHEFEIVIGDACAVDYPDDSFDLAFSNSVIEHVGDARKQADLARELRRLAPAYWVQTPSIWFPMEAHTNMPFWWFYPAPMKRALIANWRRKLPAWTEMVETTTVLSKSWMAEIFPDGCSFTELWAGLPKSYVFYRTGRK